MQVDGVGWNLTMMSTRMTDLSIFLVEWARLTQVHNPPQTDEETACLDAWNQVLALRKKGDKITCHPVKDIDDKDGSMRHSIAANHEPHKYNGTGDEAPI